MRHDLQQFKGWAILDLRGRLAVRRIMTFFAPTVGPANRSPAQGETKTERERKRERERAQGRAAPVFGCCVGRTSSVIQRALE